MARPGPKRREGERYPSGALKPNRDTGPAPAAVRRLVDAALRGAADPRFGTVIGRMLLERTLTSTQFAAAEAYGRLRGRYDRAMGLPRRSAASVLYDLPMGEARELNDRRLAQLRRDHAAMLAEVGPLKVLLDRVILDDELPGPGEMQRLRAGLGRVVGLTSDKQTVWTVDEIRLEQKAQFCHNDSLNAG